MPFHEALIYVTKSSSRYCTIILSDRRALHGCILDEPGTDDELSLMITLDDGTKESVSIDSIEDIIID